MRGYLFLFMIISGVVPSGGHAQDPSFSQFFSSPLNVSPALTGIINSQWRVVSNIRSQWSGPTSPYQTGTLSFDTRLLEDRVQESSMFGVGLMVMNDRVMNGAIVGNYASANTTFNLKLWESYNGTAHRFGAGIGGIFGHRRVDYTKLNFSEQFTGRYFDVNLPTGERSLSQMRPYFSTSAGLIYSQVADRYNLDIGYAQFHSNRPRQSFLEDPNQVLPARHVAHLGLELFVGQYVVLNTNAIYQRQGTTDYFSVGGAVAYFLGETDDMVLNIGAWYWSKNAVVPYVGYVYRNYQVGLSYDVTASKLASATRRPNTWEISIVLRGEKRKIKGIMYCPWK